MEIRDLRAELSVKTIEFEIALNNNLPHSELVEIYKQLKDLQFQLLMSEVQVKKSSCDEMIK